MEIIISVISAAVTIITVTLTNFFAKKNSLNFEKMKLKEDYYKKYLEALSYNVNEIDREKGKNELSFANNRLLLVGSVDVIMKLEIFSSFISTLEKNIDKHNALLTELIKAMRQDLYGKKYNKNYPTVGVIGKNK